MPVQGRLHALAEPVADGTVVLNEVNTLPGLTSYSPRMMAAAGLPLAEVLDRALSLALARDRR